MMIKPKTGPWQINGDGIWIESPADKGRTFLASIFDQRGRWLASHTFYVDEERNNCYWKVDHASWPEGVYLLVLRGERMLRQIKLVK